MTARAIPNIARSAQRTRPGRIALNPIGGERSSDAAAPMSDPVQFLLDQLKDPSVEAKRMFGGHGIYRDGRMFALVYDETVYMKFTDEEADTSERPPFSPRPGQTFRTFREISADELENPEALAELARSAQRAAR